MVKWLNLGFPGELKGLVPSDKGPGDLQVTGKKIKIHLEFFGKSFSIQNKGILIIFSNCWFFIIFVCSYVQEKFKATCVTKYNFLVKCMQLMFFMNINHE